MFILSQQAVIMTGAADMIAVDTATGAAVAMVTGAADMTEARVAMATGAVDMVTVAATIGAAAAAIREVEVSLFSAFLQEL
jgi:hypothetical protein